MFYQTILQCTGQKLPLYFIEGKFNQHKYHTWLRDTAVPWLHQNWEGRNDPNRHLSYQHDGCTAHTTELVDKTCHTLL